MRRFLAPVLALSTLLAGSLLAAPAFAGGLGLKHCPHGYSCVPVGAVRRGTIGNPDGRPYLRTDPNYLAFPQRAHPVVRAHPVRRVKRVRRAHPRPVVRGRYIHTRRYGRVSLHGRTKFCSDHIEWHGRRGMRNCIYVLNSLLDSRGYHLERRGYRRH